jgi:hypothetical protein
MAACTPMKLLYVCQWEGMFFCLCVVSKCVAVVNFPSLSRLVESCFSQLFDVTPIPNMNRMLPYLTELVVLHLF